MTAVKRVSDGTTGDINVRDGLRQGCTMAPVLFNLYFSAMVASWRSHCLKAVRYQVERKLVGDRTAKARLKEMENTKSKFADYAALYAIPRQAVRE